MMTAVSLRSIVLLALLAPVLAAQSEIPAPSSVRDVTLYRGQALVTRVVQVPPRSGALELVVGNLPSAIVPGSLFAEGETGAEVRAVRFRQRAVGEEPREEVRALDREIGAARGRLEEAEMRLGLIQRRLGSLDRLDTFVSDQANGDLARGRLDAEALERMVTFTFQQRTEAMKEQLAIQRDQKAAKDEIALFERKKAELTRNSSKTVREAVIFVDRASSGPGSLRLSYLVMQCGWSPSYVVRADRGAGQVELDYNALITQATGEDWKNVNFTLSTATPALSAAGPVLAPFTVSLGPRTNTREIKPGRVQVERTFAALNQRQVQAYNTLSNAVNQVDNFNSVWAANLNAGEMQCLEISSGDVLLDDLTNLAATSVEGPSLTYVIEGAVSLASRSDQQMVRIARKGLDASFVNLAIPVLSPHVFREAEVENASGLDLLQGPVTVYLDRRFVGRAEMDSVAEGERFTVGLGADPRLRTRRELLRREASTQGGNRVIEMAVGLTIENFHGEEAVVQLYDRLPDNPSIQQLRVTRVPDEHALSTDTVYVRTERPRGILRWDVKVGAKATREKALTLEHAYRLEFDRNLAFSSIGAEDQGRNREEFQQLFRGRRQR